jgi:hypothetical protein
MVGRDLDRTGTNQSVQRLVCMASLTSAAGTSRAFGPGEDEDPVTTNATDNPSSVCKSSLSRR